MNSNDFSVDVNPVNYSKLSSYIIGHQSYYVYCLRWAGEWVSRWCDCECVNNEQERQRRKAHKVERIMSERVKRVHHVWLQSISVVCQQLLLFIWVRRILIFVFLLAFFLLFLDVLLSCCRLVLFFDSFLLWIIFLKFINENINTSVTRLIVIYCSTTDRLWLDFLDFIFKGRI